MYGKSATTKITVCLLVAVLGVALASAPVAEGPPSQGRGLISWRVHDRERPWPPVVTPPQQFGQPPSDAIILFDGKDTSQWEIDRQEGSDIKWKIENGYMEIAKKAGGIRTKKSFGSCQLHIEWWVPADVDPKVTDQSRSNSGVFLMGRYEIQVLDSYTADNYKDNRTYADGQASGIYGQYPPLVNACRKGGEWQSYDISFLRPLFDDKGSCIRKARVTVIHNGVVVHNNVELQGATAHKAIAKYSPHGQAPISLQDHGNPVRFRNIWIRELPEQPYSVTE